MQNANSAKGKKINKSMPNPNCNKKLPQGNYPELIAKCNYYYKLLKKIIIGIMQNAIIMKKNLLQRSYPEINTIITGKTIQLMQFATKRNGKKKFSLNTFNIQFAAIIKLIQKNKLSQKTAIKEKFNCSWWILSCKKRSWRHKNCNNC